MKNDMDNMKLRKSWLNLALVPGTGKSEGIHHHPRNTTSYATAQGDMPNTEPPAGLSNQVRMVENAMETTEFCDSV